MDLSWSGFQRCLQEQLEKKNRFTEALDKIEATTKVPKLIIAQVVMGIFALYMIIGHFAALVCNLVGFVYPAYASIAALETSNKEDDSRWLTYWVVYAFFSCIEFFSDIIFSWFPFYWLAKIILLVWCFLPITNNGSTYFYSRMIRPWFLRNREKIDAKVERLEKAASSAAANVVLKSLAEEKKD